MAESQGETLTAWVMCNYCNRAFSHVDSLLAHKKLSHSILTENVIESSKTAKLHSSKQKDEKLNGNSKKRERSRSLSTRNKKVDDSPKDEGEKKKNMEKETIENSSPPLNSSRTSSSPSPSPKTAKTNAFNRLLSAFHPSSKTLNSKSKSKPRSSLSRRPPLPRSSSLTNTAASPSLEHRCPQCQCELESKAALSMHLRLHDTIRITPVSSQKSSSGSSSSVVDSKKNDSPVQCKLCHKILMEPFECIDCPGSPLVFDIPSVVVKTESYTDNDVDMADMDTQPITSDQQEESDDDDEEEEDEAETEDDDDDDAVIVPLQNTNKKSSQTQVISIN